MRPARGKVPSPPSQPPPPAAAPRPSDPVPSGPPGRAVVRILEETYRIRGQVPEAVLVRLAEEVDRRLRDILSRHPRLGPTRAAVLCCLNLMEELARVRGEIPSEPQVRDGRGPEAR